MNPNKGNFCNRAPEGKVWVDAAQDKVLLSTSGREAIGGKRGFFGSGDVGLQRHHSIERSCDIP